MDNSNNSEYTLEDVFPVQHKNTTTEINPLSYLGFLRDYIDDLDTSKHILIPNDIQLIISANTLIKKYQFIFKEEYGAILIFSREQLFQPTSVGMLFFNKVNTNAFTNGNECIQFVEDPEEVGYY